MHRGLFVLVLAVGIGPPAAQGQPATPTADGSAAPTAAPSPAGPAQTRARALLEKIVAGPDAGARKAAIAELDAMGATAIDALDAWLARPQDATIGARREVLAAIDALVPDKSGRFTAKRESNKERAADDEVDWLPKLLTLDAQLPSLGDVIADDAAIRALAATRELRAAKPIFDAAFRDDTMLYRDECGRFLRRLEPYSIPLLTTESNGRSDRKRYATYQLERIDRQEPSKALGAGAADEAVAIAILEVFRETKIREAVHAVWTVVNDDRPRVRAAARTTWMDYITGPPPKPAPKKKLQLPGGKLTKREKPLWLTYRELADNELRLAANELLHEDYPIEDPMGIGDDTRPTNHVTIDLEEVTQRLFTFYDTERTKRDAMAWATAKATADGGDLAVAAALIDRLIAQNPQRGERAGMATVFFAFGKELEGKQQFAEAAAAYSKAHGVDPTGARATDALAAHHYTLGKSLEADGKDGGPDFRRAVALKPDYETAQEAAETADGGRPRPQWMLYGAIAAAILAALLFLVALKRRR